MKLNLKVETIHLFLNERKYQFRNKFQKYFKLHLQLNKLFFFRVRIYHTSNFKFHFCYLQYYIYVRVISLSQLRHVKQMVNVIKQITNPYHKKEII